MSSTAMVSMFGRTTSITFAALLILVGLVLAPSAVQAQDATTFTYQGYLEESGGPAVGPVDLELKLFDATSGGTQVGPTVTKDDVALSDGVFAVDLDFGAVFGAAARYLEVGVRDGGSTGSYTTLSPREALRPAPLATALPYLRVEAAEINSNINPNVIGGLPANNAGSGVIGAVIGGGGLDNGTNVSPNTVNNSFGTISGGLDNTVSGYSATISGGASNSASEFYTAIGGGQGNTASGEDATVGGGSQNTASNSGATIGGGQRNTAAGPGATIGGGANNAAVGPGVTVSGGLDNTAGSISSTVVGGSNNLASGNYSLAAGRRAKAQNDGAFVWADSKDADFASTAPDQFLVRSDFVGINRATAITSEEVFGIRANTSSTGFGGMYMETSSSDGRPFYGYAVDGDNPAYHYYAPSTDEWVLFVSDGSPGGSTFEFNSDGDLNVPGRLTKGSGSFTIDHPQAPTEKTLSHSFVESPDMMNVYNGTVTLDAEGTATVELPDYFEALNTDFRYQLTPIGAPGPNLHIATEIEGNRFRIAGGTAGMRVSWQVTGIRNDPYARKHRIEVEEEKAPEDRGTYLHPDAYGRDR